MDGGRADIEEPNKADEVDGVDRDLVDIEKLDGTGIAVKDLDLIAEDSGIVLEA